MSLNPVWQSIEIIIFFLVFVVLAWNIREASREEVPKK
jgi:hypothetical protein